MPGIATLVFTLCFTAALSFCIRTGYAADKPVASIHNIQGEVQLRGAGDEEWTAAREGDKLFEGSQLKTGPDSQALLVWNRGHAVKVFELTRLTLDELSLKKASEKTSMNILKGKAFVRAKKLLKKESTFTIRTPTAIAGVRGTEFLVDVRGGASSFSMLSGLLGISAESGDIVLGENQAVEVAAGMQGAPEPVEVAPEVRTEMESISAEISAELEELGASAGGGGDDSADLSGAGDSGDAIDAIVNDNMENSINDVIENAAEAGYDLTDTTTGVPEVTTPDVPPMPPDTP